MKRLALTPRPDWQETAKRYGFQFHTMHGEPYWVEDAAYAFSLAEIERDLEGPTEELHALCLDLADAAVKDERLMARLQIPQEHWDYVASSWRRRDLSLYGRFDLAYDGSGPAKMLEYNADTPTSLYESAFFQWVWLEEAMAGGILSKGADQFNSIQDRLVERFGLIPQDRIFHFACWTESIEDRGTVEYLMDCAAQGGHETQMLDIRRIGIDAESRFTDEEDRVIDRLFKLYPWEWMLREPYAEHLRDSGTEFFEPPWKALLSNKAILPILWERHPGHPNLLPAWFDGEPPPKDAGDVTKTVKKPIFSREGANVAIRFGGDTFAEAEGPYGAEGAIVQAYTPLAKLGPNYAVIGSWVIGDAAAGIGVREDAGPITQDFSAFLPHVIL